MKLYLAEVSWNWEGSAVLGIFDTREKAQEACDQCKYANGDIRGDAQNVFEIELNKNLWTNEP